MISEVSVKSLLPSIRSQGISALSTDLSNTTFVGIDFGTSTTVVSIAHLAKGDFAIETESIWLNQKLTDGAILSSEKIPTVIAWHENQLLVGKGAADLKYFLKKGVDVWYSFKMELGEDLGAKYYSSVLGNDAIVTIRNPKDAAKVFFQYIKAQIDRYIREKSLPSNVKFSVSIPASFEANQRRDLVEALEHNGISVTKQALIDEPNAAFLSYIQESSKEGNPLTLPPDYNLHVLVFDFGAGTCDVSILEIGKDLKGIYSKNLSISRFEKLGGDDIDRYIALEILFPKLLKENGFKKEDFRTPEINKGIVPRLLKAAEQLKILICDAVGLQANRRHLPPLALSTTSVSLGYSIEIFTRKGRLLLEEPKLSYSEFREGMEIFFKTKMGNSKKIEGQDAFISIFNPVESALKKANLRKDEIDNVLLIGGSSKNPYVQQALTEYFSESEILIPRDLQTHVSSGAAIHSLVYNGFRKNIIQPITSEPLILLTKDETPKVILPAGTEIPSDLLVIDNLVSDRDGQDIIELPLFVGSLGKMLFNIRIYSNRQGGFQRKTPVKLELEINADKLVLVRATAAGQEAFVEPLSPFANRELSTEERIVLKAEKQVNLEAEQNGGKPTEEALRALCQAYDKIGNDLRAAETLELIHELYPKNSNLNQIGVHYSQAGHNDKAIEYYELAHEANKSQVTALNLALQLKYRDKERYEKLLEESFRLGPDAPETLVELGRNKMKKGDAEGQKMIEKAFNIYKRKYDQNQMRNWEYSWFASAAEYLNKNDFAQLIRESKPKFKGEQWYNEENLTRTFQEEGLVKR